MASPTTYLTIIKRFNYRGNTGEEFSNSYPLTGATPVDSPAWRALFDAVVLEEKKLYVPGVSVVAGYGYDKVPQVKGDHAIWTVDMTISPNAVVPGTLATSSTSMAGDQAGWVRWGLDRFNTNGKRVYLRKYFHGGQVSTGGGDFLAPAYNTALTAFGTKLLDGTLAGSRKICSPPNHKLGTPGGEIPIGSAVSPFVTMRQLKRRGKRPPTSGS